MSIARIIEKHETGFTNQQIADQMLAVHQDIKRATARGDFAEEARLNRELDLLGKQIQTNVERNNGGVR